MTKPEAAIEKILAEFDEKMLGVRRYVRPIQIKDDFGKRNESVDIIVMLEEDLALKTMKSFLLHAMSEAIKAAAGEEMKHEQVRDEYKDNVKVVANQIGREDGWNAHRQAMLDYADKIEKL